MKTRFNFFVWLLYRDLYCQCIISVLSGFPFLSGTQGFVRIISARPQLQFLKILECGDFQRDLQRGRSVFSWSGSPDGPAPLEFYCLHLETFLAGYPPFIKSYTFAKKRPGFPGRRGGYHFPGDRLRMENANSPMKHDEGLHIYNIFALPFFGND